MLNFSQIVLVFLSALTVIIGDSIVKKISIGDFWSVLRDPWMLLVYLLYFLQIAFAVYIFIYKGELAVYANMYIVFYSILGIIFGVMFFKEGLSSIQFSGIILALIGAALMNYKA